VINTSIQEFVLSRQKLEAIGLLRSYEQDDKTSSVYYELNPPMKPSKFFLNPATNKLLHKALGQERYSRLKERFKVDKVDVGSMKNITKKFNQVFKCNVNEAHHNYLNEGAKFADKKVGDIKFEESDFSIELLIQKVKRANVPSEVLTKDFLRFVVATANTYNISESNMARYIKMSINKGKVDRKFIVSSCEIWIKDSVSNDEQEFNITSITDKDLILYAKRLNPVEFLKYLYNGVKPPSQDKRIINEASRDFKLNDEVINILSYVSLIETDHRLTKSYCNFVAAQWARKNIISAEDALSQYKVTSKKKKSNYGYKKKKSKIEIPEWFDKDIEKKKPEKSAEDEIKNMLKKWG
jgi:replication initiation and membrane attachment protein